MFNNGGYSNPRMDDLISRIATETNQVARQRMITETATLIRDDVAYLPLHQQQIVWAARQNVELVQTADNYIQLRRFRVQPR